MSAPEPLSPSVGTVSGWGRILLAGLAGVALVPAFAPVDFYWVVPFALAAWFAVLWQADARTAFCLGYAFGLGLFGAGASWVFNSLLIFGSAPFAVATVITVLFVLYLALYPALLAWSAARFAARVGLVRWILFLAGGLALFEALRGWLFSGFPWLILGHTLLESPIRFWLPVAGEHGGTLLLGLLSAAVMLLWARRWLAGGAIVAAVVVAVVAAAPWNWVRPTAPELRVVLVQGNIDLERKWAADGIEHALEVYSDLSGRPAGVDLIVWPETAIPAFHFEVAPVLASYSAWLEASGAELVTGIFDLDPASGAMYNAILHVPSGAIYHKRQLVPFGEFIPLRSRLRWLDRLLDIPMSDLSPGRGSGLIRMTGTAAGVSVCYEAAYARRMRNPLPEAGLLINVSNDAWFGNTLAPYQHLQIARVRALEAGRPMIRATNTGISALIDADGRVAARSGLFTREVLRGGIVPQGGWTPAARLGSAPALLFAVLLLVPALLARRRA